MLYLIQTLYNFLICYAIILHKSMLRLQTGKTFRHKWTSCGGTLAPVGVLTTSPIKKNKTLLKVCNIKNYYFFKTDGFNVFILLLTLWWCFAPLVGDTDGGEERSGTPTAEKKPVTELLIFCTDNLQSILHFLCSKYIWDSFYTKQSLQFFSERLILFEVGCKANQL